MTDAGKILELRIWWGMIISEGKKFGYYVNEPKIWFIIKNPNHLEHADNIFKDTGVKITCEGKRHLGAVIGSNDFKSEYFREKIAKHFFTCESNIFESSSRTLLFSYSGLSKVRVKTLGEEPLLDSMLWWEIMCYFQFFPGSVHVCQTFLDLHLEPCHFPTVAYPKSVLKPCVKNLTFEEFHAKTTKS